MKTCTLMLHVLVSMVAVLIFAIGCSPQDRVRQVGPGVLIQSEKVALWLPPTRVPESHCNSGTLQEVAAQLETAVFGQIQRANPAERMRVECEELVSSRPVSFHVDNGATALELLTVIALNANCLITVDDLHIVISAASPSEPQMPGK